jgi:predicted TPR repeat methyltransferase
MKVNGQLDEGAYKKTTFDANRHLEIAISLDSSNDIAKHMLASNSLESNTVTAPQEYVKTLFDDYSDNFESSLANLDYRVPQYIAAEIASIRKTGLGRDWEAVVDLGCGTGLLVPLLDLPSTNLVMGVDLSPKMLDIAAEKGVYDILSAGDIVDFLEDMATFRDVGPKDENTIEWIETAPESAKQSLKAKLEKRDAILFAAADVLVYIGELRRLFSALRRVMTIGDAFVFTVENADRSPDKSELSLKAGWLLQSTGRYAHHLAYVERLAAEMSMEGISCAERSPA